MKPNQIRWIEMAENGQARETFPERYIRDCTDTGGRVAENGFH
jgi:hypothetical protein